VSPSVTGVLYFLATLAVMLAGVPIAFSLGIVAVGFMLVFMPGSSLDTFTQNVYEEIANITLLSIPLFILKGAAIGRSRAGADLYGAMHAWLHRIPGGLGIANVFACALFAAMAGSSPATCSAIGGTGIAQMRARGYSEGLATGIIAAGGTLGILLPPSVTMILFSVAAEQSLGRLFLAGVGPGLLLVAFFSIYASWKYARERRQAFACARNAQERGEAGHSAPHAILREEHYTLAEKARQLPRILPFLVLLIGVMVALYGGLATPSETAGLGGLLALALVSVIYGAWRPRDWAPFLRATVRESTMLMFIIGMSLLYTYVMSYLHISQGAAQWIVALELPRWGLLAAVLGFTVVLGFFLPPVSVILMTAPIVLAPLRAAGFDLVWFGVVMTIVMEMGLIHPPVGLNLFVIRSVAPDIPLRRVVAGVLPFVGLMVLAILLLCVLPQVALWLPGAVYG
jgi:C4-dicarboxylate transporter DctM subunit